MDTHTHSQADKQTQTDTEWETQTQTLSLTNTLTHSQTHIDRQTDTHTHTHTHTHTFINTNTQTEITHTLGNKADVLSLLHCLLWALTTGQALQRCSWWPPGWHRCRGEGGGWVLGGGGGAGVWGRGGRWRRGGHLLETSLLPNNGSCNLLSCKTHPHTRSEWIYQ